MKIRTGFVSNSSSSSFLCEVCGETESGFDCSLSEFDMISCENDHICHIDCIDEYDSETFCKTNKWKEWVLKQEHCPICNLKSLHDSTILLYLLKNYKDICGNFDSIKDEIRKRFSTIKELMKWIQE